MIEDEFYDIEDYRGVEEFKAKAYASQLYFNFKRKNRYKGRKAPVEILKEAGSSVSPQVFNLPPVILDNFHCELVEHGYRVGSSGSLQRTFHLTIFFRLRMFNCTQRSWQKVAHMRAMVLVDPAAKPLVGKRR